jgi:aminoglycoside phosphotransferase (APT) family kinase protein
MDVLDVDDASGARTKITLRRLMGDHRASPEDAEREYQTLVFLKRAGIPAPEPLFLDAAGAYFGAPTLALTWVPGRPVFPREDLAPWAHGLAEIIARVHAVTEPEYDLSYLERRTRDWTRERIAGWRDEATFDPLAPEIQAALAARLDDIGLAENTLVHNDYWSGNVVWYRGIASAIVDWTPAVAGDPRADVAECRVDFALSHGLEVGDLFRDAYEQVSGKPVHDLWFYDLYRGFTALREYPEWLAGYHDLGQTHVSVEDAGARLRAFLRRALDLA